MEGYDIGLAPTTKCQDPELTGPRRVGLMLENLVAVLRDQAILLVLDNFETNLEPDSVPGAAEPHWACQDPAWDRCLALLAAELAGTPSRVLITSRRPLAALAGTASHRVRLGPLPAAEAALYLREHAGLSKMVFGGDPGEKALALRLLDASRFHPLLMDRLARLATGGPSLRPQLMQALDALEQTKDFSQLPALFATGGGDAKELAYLDDALTTSLDQLIAAAGAEARRLLWMIAVANEPVTLGLLKDVWSGKNFELQHLLAIGLATEERSGPDDADPELTCHELVRERIRTWMRDHEPDRAGLTEDAIRLAYAERLEAAFKALQHQDMTTALQAGSRALVYCVQAGAYDRLGNFASRVVTGTSDPRLLEGLLPHLEAAAGSAPEGRPRWRCLGTLADALRQAGRPDASLPFYEQAAAQARTAAEAGGEDARQRWADLAWITGNWANALLMTGDLDASRQRHLESAEAGTKAGSPVIHVIGREVEALRVDIMQGRAAEALPQVEARLARVEDWWQRHRAGQAVPEAPDPELLARTLISTLDIAKDAHRAQDDWESALRRIDAVLEVERALQRPAEDIAIDRMNRAIALGRLGRFAEAKAELEESLQVFQNNPAMRARVLSSLANLFDEQGDVPQAITQGRRALALREHLPDPGDRAISHGNLANYLERSGTPSALAESPRHQLAALVYRLVSGLGQDLKDSLHSYAILFRRARAAGTPPAVPRLAELLADPAFRPLAEWLRQRQADLAEVQAAVDQFLEQARKKAIEDE
jgi:tetratricopeptide (TPR) repeat protein